MFILRKFKDQIIDELIDENSISQASSKDVIFLLKNNIDEFTNNIIDIVDTQKILIYNGEFLKLNSNHFPAFMIKIKSSYFYLPFDFVFKILSNLFINDISHLENQLKIRYHQYINDFMSISQETFDTLNQNNLKTFQLVHNDRFSPIQFSYLKLIDLYHPFDSIFNKETILNQNYTHRRQDRKSQYFISNHQKDRDQLIYDSMKNHIHLKVEDYQYFSLEEKIRLELLKRKFRDLDLCPVLYLDEDFTIYQYFYDWSSQKICIKKYFSNDDFDLFNTIVLGSKSYQSQSSILEDF